MRIPDFYVIIFPCKNLFEVIGMIRRTTALLLCLLLCVFCLLPAAGSADAETKIIRVGWYETPFNYRDSAGRRTGYAYEYQRKIAAYTGWKYEYIEGTWSELLQMLKDGRIDLLSDVSRTEDRLEYMCFSGLPMGTELYYLYVNPGNTSVSITDAATLNGKKIGVTRSSIQKDLFLQWEEENGVRAEIIDLDCSEEESLRKMKFGELDAFVILDTYSDPDLAIPLWKIGSSDFYFAVSNNRPDLLAELDAAMSRIQEENKHYSEQLSAKYLHDSGTNRYLTEEENAWLEAHGPIRVGYQDNYLAFCASDPKTGELTGALKDYLASASAALENARPVFEAVCFPTAADAMEALKDGRIDCMFPANLTDYDGEMAGVALTAPLMRTEMDAVIREEDKQTFLRSNQVRVGVNRGNPNYEYFLRDHFPGWTPVYYSSTPECLDQVAARNADCIIVSNYRFSDIARQCSRLNLTTVYTGVEMDYCLAVKEGSTILYSILSRLIRQIPESTVNAALNYYSAAPETAGFFEYLLEHPVVLILGIVCIILLAAVGILLFRMRAQKKPAE